MNVQIFVQNLKSILDERGISYARAGRESGAGEEFVRNMERKGSAPSVEKVQQIAKYLGVTTSELLGETDRTGPGDEKKPTVQDDGLTQMEQELIGLFRRLTPEQQDFVIGSVRAAADKL